MTSHILCGVVLLLLFIFEKGKEDLAKVIPFRVSTIGLG